VSHGAELQENTAFQRYGILAILSRQVLRHVSITGRVMTNPPQPAVHGENGC
jgi:hypothetical protein